MPVTVTSADSLTTITIDRPERANALDTATIGALHDAVVSTYAREGQRVVVITGGGARAFAAGADLGELGGFDSTRAERFIRSLHEAMQAVRDHPCPVIAAVNGTALGAGLELVVACDIAIAADHARFGMPEVRLGVPSVIEAAMMPITIGLMRTRELLLTGDPIDAAEAHRIGLLNQVVPAAQLSTAIDTMAERLAQNAPNAVTLQKRLMNRWLDLPLHAGITEGITAFAAAYDTKEPAERVTAFRSSRSEKAD